MEISYFKSRFSIFMFHHVFNWTATNTHKIGILNHNQINVNIIIKFQFYSY